MTGSSRFSFMEALDFIFFRYENTECAKCGGVGGRAALGRGNLSILWP